MFARIGAWLVQKVGLPVAKWVGLELLQRLIEWAKTTWIAYKEEKARKKRAEEAARRNETYAQNPTDDTFGESP